MLHSIFWDNLSPDGGDRPEGELAAAINEHFGTFEAFQKQLTTARAAPLGGGVHLAGIVLRTFPRGLVNAASACSPGAP